MGVRNQLLLASQARETQVGAAQSFYLDTVNGTTSGNGSTPGQAVSTFALALALCTANRGDEIVVVAGSTISIASAGLDLNKAGVTLRGLGRGTKKPILSWAATDSVFTLSADNVSIKNFKCVAAIDEVVSAILVTGTNVLLEGVDVVETTSIQFIQWLKTSTAGDDLTITKCKHIQRTAAGSAQKWIELIGCDRPNIVDNQFHLTLNNAATSATITSTGTAALDVDIRNNRIIQLGGTTQVSAILMLAGSTGRIDDNRISSAFTAIAGTVAAASCHCANNLCSNTVNLSGILDPGVDS